MMLNVVALVLLILVLASYCDAQDTIEGFRTVSNELAAEITLLRSNPSTYARYLEEFLASFVDELTYQRKDGKKAKSQEGKAVVKEAIDILRKTLPSAGVKSSIVLERAARHHGIDIHKNELVGHTGSDGHDTQYRIEEYGQWQEKIGENIYYGSTNVRNVIVNLLIDDGVPDRIHRKNLLDTEFKHVGGVVGPHSLHGSSIVMNFAAVITDIIDIETHPQQLHVHPGDSLSHEFKKVINSIPGKKRYIDDVRAGLRSLEEVLLDYDPVKGKAQLLFHRNGATRSINIDFKLNARLQWDESKHEGHHAHDGESPLHWEWLAFIAGLGGLLLAGKVFQTVYVDYLRRKNK